MRGNSFSKIPGLRRKIILQRYPRMHDAKQVESRGIHTPLKDEVPNQSQDSRSKRRSRASKKMLLIRYSDVGRNDGNRVSGGTSGVTG